MLCIYALSESIKTRHNRRHARNARAIRTGRSMKDFVDGTAFNAEQGNRARKLFAAVVLAALDDAIADDKKYGNGPEQIARWARGAVLRRDRPQRARGRRADGIRRQGGTHLGRAVARGERAPPRRRAGRGRLTAPHCMTDPAPSHAAGPLFCRGRGVAVALRSGARRSSVRGRPVAQSKSWELSAR